ncbi:MAG TPA: NHLP-related RiPP peptide [Dokdonella sp.]|uniref:NHLP-related RiPP peptide n=1 Tax=Dokdonella sp. TaxID=2291710 RepID=UPI002D7F5888|nr:NHLP-related RiPP peptide [Dokdonella sp.]HET9031396.1 NHLP-related RiPP peptide [Dokdonella sp.]
MWQFRATNPQGEVQMPDSTLSRDQAVTLLRKLGSDDAFRSLFEAQPAEALRSIGVAAETIEKLDAKCMTPAKLADKGAFLSASGQLNDSVVTNAMTMNTPKLNLKS